MRNAIRRMWSYEDRLGEVEPPRRGRRIPAGRFVSSLVALGLVASHVMAEGIVVREPGAQVKLLTSGPAEARVSFSAEDPDTSTTHLALHFGLVQGEARISRPLWVPGGTCCAGEVGLATSENQLGFQVDADDDSNLGFSTHKFVWYLDGIADSQRMMVLQRFGFNSAAELLVDGDVTANGFDLAEGFWMSEPVQPGEAVSLDPARPGAVRKSTGAGDPLLLGVVSSDPALVMGGHAFSAERLAAEWGEEVAAQLEEERLELEAQAYAEEAALAAERDRLASVGSHSAWRAEQVLDTGPGEEIAAHAKAVESHRSHLADAVMQRFFARHVARVALAGRVPVLADAAFGPILPGDPLTSSSVPGVAMRATGPGPVLGVALEGLAAGRGTVLTLVDREWYPGEAPRLATARSLEIDERLVRLESQLAARDEAIADLRRHLAAMKAHLVQIAGETPIRRVASRGRGSGVDVP